MDDKKMDRFYIALLNKMRDQFDKSEWIVQYSVIFQLLGEPKKYFRFINFKKLMCFMIDLSQVDLSMLTNDSLVNLVTYIKKCGETSNTVFPYTRMTDERFTACMIKSTGLKGFAVKFISDEEIQNCESLVINGT